MASTAAGEYSEIHLPLLHVKENDRKSSVDLFSKILTVT